MVYCELCRNTFCTDSAAALCSGGELIAMQRGAGRRAPLVCPTCVANPVKALEFMDAETKVMIDVASSIRNQRTQRLAAEVREDQRSYQSASRLRESAVAKSKERSNSHNHAREQWAKWRIPLMQAFQSQGELTSRDVENLLNMKFRHPSLSIAYVRRAGVPIVKVRVEHFDSARRKNCYRNWYGLSSKPIEELAPLTPPQDSQTHQFMREVKPEFNDEYVTRKFAEFYKAQGVDPVA
jgi:hypothetical protein